MQFGVHRSLILDIHPVNTSHALKSLAKKYDFELKYNPAYYHTRTGLAEVANKSLEQALKFYIQTNKDLWPEYVAHAVYARST